jgi:hypothetical protein
MTVNLERFKRHVVFLDDSDDSCWVWIGALRDDGRGRAWVNGQERRAHRVAWELLNGRPIPPSMRLTQECGHPQCVRHWRLDRPGKKLTAEEVLQIRSTSIPSHALAVRYGVAGSYIRQIRCGFARPYRTDRTRDNGGGRACA